MQKSFEIRSVFRRNYLGLLLVTLVLVLNANAASARETYVAYATRLLEQPPDNAEVRPDMEAAVLKFTNAYRASRKLPPFKPADPVLLQAARAHAMDLLTQGTMGHTSSTGHDFAARMRAFQPGQMFMAQMAENAARLRKSELSEVAKAQSLVTQWIESSGHRKNMTNRTYVAVAIGVVSRGKDTYAVQIFAAPPVKTNMGGSLFQGVRP